MYKIYSTVVKLFKDFKKWAKKWEKHQNMQKLQNNFTLRAWKGKIELALSI